MLCGDVMLSYVVKCHAADPVSAVARWMRDEKLGFIPVVDAADHPLGVITDRDLVIRALADELPPSTPIAMVMTKAPLLTCYPDEDLRDAEERMAEQKRSRALVIDRGGRCIGIISLSDIAQFEDPVDAGRLMREVTRRESSMGSR